MVDDWSEVCWPVELDGLKALVVRLQNPLDSVAIGVVHIAILGEEFKRRGLKRI